MRNFKAWLVPPVLFPLLLAAVIFIYILLGAPG